MDKTQIQILIVDDDPSAVRLLVGLLSAQGYQVSSASDGLDALVTIKNNKPDLVVLDVMMPEINGYDVCYQLRFNKDFEKIPILLLTIRDQELDDRIARSSRIEYLPKPVNTKLLLEKIEQLLSDHV